MNRETVRSSPRKSLRKGLNPTKTNQPHPIVQATIKDNILTISIPLQAPRPSASGKTLVVASSGGNVTTTATVDGKPVTIGLNAYIKP